VGDDTSGTAVDQAQEPVGWPWRIFSAVAALLGAGAAISGAEVDNWVSVIFLWVGYTVLVVVLYSYIVDIRR
jgi:uncharacterized membrane protein YoaK (UPF0700 family)